MQLLATQWRLCRIQLVNWGTFDGYNDLPIVDVDADGAASVVAITGKSGTGKSTLFDAGTVLLMPYGRTLNAASNLGRGGSPREVRTYLKGMVDTVEDERGRAKGKYLRDDSTLIWSAIVHTWRDTCGSLFSAARFFQLKPQGSENDLAQTFVTIADDLDPRPMRRFASSRFRAQNLREVYPGCVIHEGSGKFLREVYTTLGIGEDGDGTNAMKLMYRIQSGIPMTNVDDLFKELVLDEPSTLARAREAIDCFDRGQDVWKKLDEARRKREMLSGIDEIYARMLEARTEAELARSLDHTNTESPFTLWIERHRLELAVAQHASDERALTRLVNELASTKVLVSDLDAEVDELYRAVLERGGAELDRLDQALRQETEHRPGIVRRCEELKAQLDHLDKELPDDEQSYLDLLMWADDVVEGADETLERLQAELDELGVDVREAEREVIRCQEELDDYRSRHTRITSDMARARGLISQAAGLTPAEIPFAAELMDLPREQELWRRAVNISLAPIADRLLVDKRREAEFRRLIDPLADKLGRRYHFDFVDLDEDYVDEPKEGCVSSKVVYRSDSPFASYVRHLVCNATDHRCVDTVAYLAGRGPRITPSGQERVGNRGAIGHSNRTLIIGFSNDMLVEDCEAELENAQMVLNELRRTHRKKTVERNRHRWRVDAARTVLHVRFEEIDLRGCDRRIQELREQLGRLEHDDKLAELKRMHRDAKRRFGEACLRQSHLEEDIADTSQSLATVADLCVQAQTFVEALERAGVMVTDRQAAVVADSVVQTEATLGERASIVASFDKVISQARLFVGATLARRTADEEKERRNLETAFRNYHTTFMDADREHGCEESEYPYYHQVLAELVQQGLDEPESEWEAAMIRDVAQHLSRLQEAFQNEERALDERLRPVNEILGQFVFGERRGRLSVVSEKRSFTDVTKFRTTLRRLTSLATAYDFPEGDKGVSASHREIERFVGVLRHDLKTTGKHAHHYLDCRHTVHITARETPARGSEGSFEPVLYDSINGKSGGQYQELVAFILGAALLYCLGYNYATMPSYAPVYLDEAFIKADSEHTRRALGALSGLGFQVVIAVPDGKVEAVAPLASQIISLTKDERTNTTRAKALLRRTTGDVWHE